MTSSHLDRPRTDRAPRVVRWYLQTNRWWARWIIRRRYRVVIHGAEHVPASGPVILAANHVGVIDGPLLAVFSPRPAHALTKMEMFRGPLGPFLRLAGQIKLDRFRTDPQAVKTAVRALRDGLAVGIFPEGTRGTGELERFHRGAGYLALVTGAPVVPVIIFGTRDPGGASSSLPTKGATLDLVYGRAVTIDRQPWPRTQEQVAAASRVLRDRMLTELEEAQRSTGRSLPGPLPAGQHEPDPGGGITEKSA
ncbi:MAG: lysophospholipid acyltransferase family protein [Nocardioides sp.]